MLRSLRFRFKARAHRELVLGLADRLYEDVRHLPREVVVRIAEGVMLYGLTPEEAIRWAQMARGAPEHTGAPEDTAEEGA
jgi:hypothetical protein